MTDENMGVGKSWSRQYGEPELDEYDMPKSAYVPWLDKVVRIPPPTASTSREMGRGAGCKSEFLYINDWNEWTAGKYQPNNGGTPHGLEETIPFSLWTSTMPKSTGASADEGRLYRQLLHADGSNIRRYKGVRPIPVQRGYNTIRIDGEFNDWEK
jgi:hypothetical protein